MFIGKTDISSGLYPEIRDLLVRFSEAAILLACKTAERTLESHLTKRYLIRPELEKTGTDRDELLVLICRDIAIYYLYAPAETFPAKIVKKYDDAKGMLEDYANGTMTLIGVPSAPDPDETTPEGNQIGWGGRPPRASLV